MVFDTFGPPAKRRQSAAALEPGVNTFALYVFFAARQKVEPRLVPMAYFGPTTPDCICPA